MDEESLAPMADALSATLAVFILLICFFVMAQVDAVSRQIKLELVGDNEKIFDSIEIDFEKMAPKKDQGRDQLVFFNSFNTADNLERVETLIDDVREGCGDCAINVMSNYPLHGVTLKRAKKRALVNALKLVKILEEKNIKYEINIMTNHNYYFIELEAIKE